MEVSDAEVSVDQEPAAMTVPVGLAVARFTGITGFAGELGLTDATGPAGAVVSRGMGCTMGARVPAGVAGLGLVAFVNAQLFFSLMAKGRPPERPAMEAVLAAELLAG